MLRRGEQFVGGCVLLSLALVPVAPVVAAKGEAVVPDCAKLDNPQANFTPRAYTLTSVYVRSKVPEYSFVRGQWVLGEVQGILPPRTCLHVLKREEVGVIQVWYWIRYLDSAKQLRTGWVWAGTKGKDEGNYIGGDTAPKMSAITPSGSSDGVDVPPLAAFFVSSAFAQGDMLPPPDTKQDDARSFCPTPGDENLDYLYELPLLGWTMQFSTFSTIILFLVMLAGMIAKTFWDATEREQGPWPTWNKLFRPFLVSPIAFSAFWGPMDAQREGKGLMLTIAMVLYAFQIGFMWQHVLEKKVEEDGKAPTHT